MTGQVPNPYSDDTAHAPETGPRGPLVEAAGALNGLRELAGRVQSGPSSRNAPQTGAAIPLPAQQLSLELQQEAVASLSGGAPESAPVPQAPEGKAAAAAPAASAPALPKTKRAHEILRERREQLGISLEEISEEIKVKLVHLRAMEEGRYNDLPSRTHALGWARVYAKSLRLDDNALASLCRSEMGGAPPRLAPPPAALAAADSAPRHLPGSSLITACVVLAVAVYAMSYGYFRPAAEEAPLPPPPPDMTASAPENAPVATVAPASAPAPAPVAVSASASSDIIDRPKAPVEAASPPVADESMRAMAEEGPVAPSMDAETEGPSAAGERPYETHPAEAPPAGPAAAVSAREEARERHGLSQAASSQDMPLPRPRAKIPPPSRIKLRAAEDTEVRIVDRLGRVLAERVIHRGEAFYVPDNRHYSLATSDAGALRVQVDGRALPPLGEAGEPMHNIPLAPAQLLQAMGE